MTLFVIRVIDHSASSDRCFPRTKQIGEIGKLSASQKEAFLDAASGLAERSNVLMLRLIEAYGRARKSCVFSTLQGLVLFLLSR